MRALPQARHRSYLPLHPPDARVECAVSVFHASGPDGEIAPLTVSGGGFPLPDLRSNPVGPVRRSRPRSIRSERSASAYD